MTHSTRRTMRSVAALALASALCVSLSGCKAGLIVGQEPVPAATALTEPSDEPVVDLSEPGAPASSDNSPSDDATDLTVRDSAVDQAALCSAGDQLNDLDKTEAKTLSDVSLRVDKMLEIYTATTPPQSISGNWDGVKRALADLQTSMHDLLTGNDVAEAQRLEKEAVNTYNTNSADDLNAVKAYVQAHC